MSNCTAQICISGTTFTVQSCAAAPKMDLLKGCVDVRGASLSLSLISAPGKLTKSLRSDSFTAAQNSVTHRQTVLKPTAN